MSSNKASRLERILGAIERAGNALPQPATLFLLFAGFVLLVSALAATLGASVIHPGTGETEVVTNLLSADGIRWIISNLVTNYTGFAPLGIVMVAMLGIGLAESSGLIHTALRLLVMSAPPRLLTFVVVLAGVLSNVAGDVGYVLLIPLAAVMFLAVGRHPIAGMAAAFAGVSGGFSANLLIGAIDPLLAGLTEEAARIIDPTYTVNPAANYYFMAVSTFFVAAAGTLVTEWLVEPHLGPYQEEGGEAEASSREITPRERRGLRRAGLTVLALFVLVGVVTLPADGFLRGEDGRLISSPLIDGVVVLLLVVASAAGLVYGFTTGRFKSDRDVLSGMTNSMRTLAGYLVLVFFAAQFVAFFRESNLGLVLAVTGAEALQALNLGVVPLVLSFVLLAAMMNMLMGSASAKWGVMAPVFVPMFMLLGFSPELSQAAFRVGDSVTNLISPMMSFFALVISFFERYDKRAGVGTVIATMLPYSVALFVTWAVLIAVWILLGIPLGPGAGINYPA